MNTQNRLDILATQLELSTQTKQSPHKLGSKLDPRDQFQKRTKQSIQESPETPPLPVEKYKESIKLSVNANPITIIVAETGAGKSTQVPKYLSDEGWDVVVTQPRIVAARSLAERVSKEMGTELGGEVGYHTAQEKLRSNDTKITFCTDGLQVVKEVTDRGVKGKTVLVIDEVHECNVNIETLLALVHKKIKEGEEIKVVLMSATIDSEKLSEFFGTDEKKAPVIDVPGKLYPVEKTQIRKDKVCVKVSELVQNKQNVLVFMPGVGEIEKTIQDLEKTCPDAEILPLHSGLTPTEQQKVFKHYDRPKIVVATNIAQTSITIDDIHAVVDSGLERRLEVQNGIEGLYLKNISESDCKQRAGRAGRCREGQYFLCSEKSLEERNKYPTPEIQRVRLDQMVLRLLNNGFDATQLTFFHQPDPKTLEIAKETLIRIGAITPECDVTKIGKEISKFPIDVHIGRMLVEAQKNGCMDDMLTIAACFEADGLLLRNNSQSELNTLTQNLTPETESDFLAELDIYNQASNMTTTEMKEKGISPKKYFIAKENKKRMQRRTKSNNNSSPNRESILKCIVAGMMDYVGHSVGQSYSCMGNTRLPDKKSVTSKCGNSEWVIGVPKDIPIKGDRTLPLLTWISRADPEWIMEFAPDRIESTERSLFWDESDQAVKKEIVYTMDGDELKSEGKEVEYSKEALEIFCNKLKNNMQGEVFDEIRSIIAREKNTLYELWIKSEGEQPNPTPEFLSNILQETLSQYQITSVRQFHENVSEKNIIPKLKEAFDNIVTDEEKQKIRESNPTSVTIHGKKYDVTYGWYSIHGSSIAKITVTMDEFYKIQQDDLEGLIPSGIDIYLKINTENKRINDLGSNNINYLRECVEEEHIKEAWDKFLEHNKYEYKTLKTGEELQLPPPIVYYEKTGLKAYPLASVHQYCRNKDDGRYEVVVEIYWTEYESLHIDGINRVTEEGLGKLNMIEEIKQKVVLAKQILENIPEWPGPIMRIEDDIEVISRRTTREPNAYGYDIPSTLEEITEIIQELEEENKKQSTVNNSSSQDIQRLTPTNIDTTKEDPEEIQIGTERPPNNVFATLFNPTQNQTDQTPVKNPQKIPKQKEKPEQTQPIIVLSDMSEDQLIQKYEDVNNEIKQILEGNPEIETAEAQLIKEKDTLANIKTELKNLKSFLKSQKNQKNQNTKTEISKLNSIKNTVELNIDRLKPLIFITKSLREKLQTLKKQQEEIENIFN